MRTDAPTVLLVDDDDNHALFMRIAFGRAGSLQTLQFVNDGDQAMAYLLGKGRFKDRELYPSPAVVLMDLNMPGKGGFEMLESIRRHPDLRRLCVYIVSGSDREEDIVRAYELGANSYLVKPITLDALTHLAKCLVAWLKVTHFAPLVNAAEPQAYAAGIHEPDSADGAVPP